MELNLPQEIFDMIIHYIKSQKWHITIIRCFARTCQMLNLVLHDYIMIKQKEYRQVYASLRYTMKLTRKTWHINELILDNITNVRMSPTRLYINPFMSSSLNKFVECEKIVCYAAAIIGNVELIKEIPIEYLKLCLPAAGVCVGYGCNDDMLDFFKNLVEVDAPFWKFFLCGALIGGNTLGVKYCKRKCSPVTIKKALQKLGGKVNDECRELLK